MPASTAAGRHARPHLRSVPQRIADTDADIRAYFEFPHRSPGYACPRPRRACTGKTNITVTVPQSSPVRTHSVTGERDSPPVLRGAVHNSVVTSSATAERLLAGHLAPDDRADRLGYDRNTGGAKLLDQHGLSWARALCSTQPVLLTLRFNAARSCLRHAAAATTRMRKDSLLTSENIRKTGIPGCCRPAPGVQDPHKGPQAITGMESQNPWSGAGSNRRPSAFQAQPNSSGLSVTVA
jgi:hypothetical protein